MAWLLWMNSVEKPRLCCFTARQSRRVISHFWDCQQERRVIWGLEMNHRARFLLPTTTYCAICSFLKKKLTYDPSDRSLSVTLRVFSHGYYYCQHKGDLAWQCGPNTRISRSSSIRLVWIFRCMWDYADSITFIWELTVDCKATLYQGFSGGLLWG